MPKVLTQIWSCRGTGLESRNPRCYARNHPQVDNNLKLTSYFQRLCRKVQVRSRSNPSSVNLLFSLLTRCFRNSKMSPISTATDCWRKEKFTTNLKITEAIQIRGKILALTTEVHSIEGIVKRNQRKQRWTGKVWGGERIFFLPRDIVEKSCEANVGPEVRSIFDLKSVKNFHICVKSTCQKETFDISNAFNTHL